jgi:hypothetical protein
MSRDNPPCRLIDVSASSAMPASRAFATALAIGRRTRDRLRREVVLVEPAARKHPDVTHERKLRRPSGEQYFEPSAGLAQQHDSGGVTNRDGCGFGGAHEVSPAMGLRSRLRSSHDTWVAAAPVLFADNDTQLPRRRDCVRSPAWTSGTRCPSATR